MKIRVWQRGNVVSPATIRQRVSWGLVETNWRAPNSRTISVGNACKERKGEKNAVRIDNASKRARNRAPEIAKPPLLLIARPRGKFPTIQGHGYFITMNIGRLKWICPCPCLSMIAAVDNHHF